MVPVLRVNGTNALLVFLMMVAVFGALHLLAASTPDARLSKAWVSLGF